MEHPNSLEKIMLQFLIDNDHKYTSIKDLIKNVWGRSGVKKATVAQNISVLRKKGNQIELNRKLGYKLFNHKQ
jgi:DNA-binding winged helix-turn-helix (wHTH) protein